MMRHQNDRGLSLVEVMVSSALLVVVLAVFGTLYAVVKRATNVSQAMGAGTDQMALALATLDAQVRSAYWTAETTTNCKDSAGVMGTCTVVKILTTYQATPNAPRCWVWKITPLPGIVGHPNVDPFDRYGLLQSASYAPAPPWASLDWTVEADSLDVGGSSISVAAPITVLDPVTGGFVGGHYSGVKVEASIAQDNTRRMQASFVLSGRNALLSATPAWASLTCPMP